MDKVTSLLGKGAEVADVLCTSPNEMAVWIIATALICACLGAIAGRLTAPSKKPFGRQ
jgi:hypothetical protein